jgi:hypothetical protein
MLCAYLHWSLLRSTGRGRIKGPTRRQRQTNTLSFEGKRRSSLRCSRRSPSPRRERKREREGRLSRQSRSKGGQEEGRRRARRSAARRTMHPPEQRRAERPSRREDLSTKDGHFVVGSSLRLRKGGWVRKSLEIRVSSSKNQFHQFVSNRFFSQVQSRAWGSEDEWSGAGMVASRARADRRGGQDPEQHASANWEQDERSSLSGDVPDGPRPAEASSPSGGRRSLSRRRRRKGSEAPSVGESGRRGQRPPPVIVCTDLVPYDVSVSEIVRMH